VARRTGLSPEVVRARNFYHGTGDTRRTHYGQDLGNFRLQELWDRALSSSEFERRRTEVAAWNRDHIHVKRGLAITPVKFGISFTATQFNQAGALVSVYTDGSVRVNHGGTEMGQGLHTKVCSVVAQVLGLPMSQVRISSSDTDKVANASATAASSGTDLNGRAAERAALQVRKNMAECLAKADACDAKDVQFNNNQVSTPKQVRSFEQAVQFAYSQRIQLWSDGFYATPKIHYDRNTLSGRPFYYFAYGAAFSDVVVDTLTGEHNLLSVDILHDVGNSLNPDIDIGQVEGGFVQGMGWLTTEEMIWNDDGVITSNSPANYKIPTSADVPAAFNVALFQRPNGEDSIHRSKAVGEPPLMLANAVWCALRDACASFAGYQMNPVLKAPATPEQVYWAVQQAKAFAGTGKLQ
jgi:xanthine dehydrogenase large subunit